MANLVGTVTTVDKNDKTIFTGDVIIIAETSPTNGIDTITFGATLEVQAATDVRGIEFAIPVKDFINKLITME